MICYNIVDGVVKARKNVGDGMTVGKTAALAAYFGATTPKDGTMV